MWADIHNLHLAGFGIALLLGNQFALRLENEVPTGPSCWSWLCDTRCVAVSTA
jgi:hypothetical protein